MMIPTGRARISPTCNRQLSLWIEKLYVLMYRASASAVVNFTSSVGCRATGPITIHERAPFTSLPTKSTPIRMRIVIQ